VPRPRLHPTDTILDSARDLLLDEGAGAATMNAIAHASGAPTGSIYHRFGSRDALLTRLWIRAVRRSQASFLAALEEKDTRAAALGAALSVFDFCAQEPGEARLLLSFRREDLIPKLPATGPLAEELRELNRPIERAIADLASRLTGRRTRRVLEGTLLAVFDLPYGAVRRHLIAGQAPPPHVRADLTLAASAVIEQLANESSAQRSSEGDPSDP
jgi:AcrR family transcriptional regulator